MNLRTRLRVSALFVAVLTIALWFFGGFNFGTTRLVVPVEHPPQGGQAVVVEETRFLPGLDFLAIGFALTAGLWIAGHFCASDRTARLASENNCRS